MRSRLAAFSLLSVSALCALVACGEDEQPTPIEAGKGGRAGSGGSGAKAGAGGTNNPTAGAAGSSTTGGSAGAATGGSAGAATAGSAGATAGGSAGTTAGGSAGAPASNDIVAIASATPSFSTLVELVAAAGLVDTLKGAGPFTVFAPTNDAFNVFLNDTGLTLAALKDPANKTILTEFLIYHVSAQPSAAIPATKGIYAAELLGLPDLSTALSATQKTAFLDVSLPASGRLGGPAFVGLAAPLPFYGPIATADVAASNGVIHVVSKVLVPPKYVSYDGTIKRAISGAKSTVVDLAVLASTAGLGNGPELKTLTALVVKCKLNTTLSTTPDLTILAPTDAAFATAGIHEGTDCSVATPVLQYHVIPAVLSAKAAGTLASGGERVATLLDTKKVGFKLPPTNVLHVDDGSSKLPAVVIKNLQTSNAVVHVVDKVLTPPK